MTPPKKSTAEMVVGGRYLDRLERRGRDWRIAEQAYVMDWNRNIPSTARWDEGIYAGLKRRGGRLPDDPLEDFLASWTAEEAEDLGPRPLVALCGVTGSGQ